MGCKGDNEVSQILRIAGVDDIDILRRACRTMSDRGTAADDDEADAVSREQGQEFAKVSTHEVLPPPEPVGRRPEARRHTP